MEQQICKNCVHYRQHYTFDNRRLFQVFCGHCVQQPTKNKKPDKLACEKFVLRQPDEYAFATKEYLSKELLQYVLRLELLPEIQELPR